jgi:hypothetical protein
MDFRTEVMTGLKTSMLLLLVFCASCVWAQNAPLHIDFSVSKSLYAFPSGDFLLYKTSAKQIPKPIAPLSIPAFEYNPQIAKGAIFCRLENQFCEHYNIWLKIRAGDVEEYHRLIEKKQ